MKNIILSLLIAFQTLAAFANPEGWSVNSSEFEYSLTITGVVKINNSELSAENDIVAAFVNGECRGVANATYVDAYQKYYFFLTVFSSEYSGEEVILKYYNKTQDSIFVGFDALAFKDGDNLGTASEPYIIQKGAVNYNLTISNDSVSENLSAGTLIGQLVASSAKESAQYEFILGTLLDEASFELIGDKLYSKVVFNYEKQSVYRINASAISTLLDTVKQEFQIDVINVNDAPYDLTLSADTISENMPIGTFVGLLLASDEDADDSISYEVTEGQFTVSGDSLLTAAFFDYEAEPLQTVMISATDIQGGQVTSTLTINVLDAVDTKVDDVQSLQFAVFPNPTSHSLFLNIPNSIERLIIFNTTGQIVYVSNYYQRAVDVSSFKQGIYFIKVFSQTKTGVKQFIKE
ncbi:MAG: T9SS type A sorting domain-containing protein [Salinivirgaceae bacterium]|jgi:hypothetical protein|nr:T9SS type A sorting domain-containing protein [Salinivirgaceae bacterium]